MSTDKRYIIGYLHLAQQIKGPECSKICAADVVVIASSYKELPGLLLSHLLPHTRVPKIGLSHRNWPGEMSMSGGELKTCLWLTNSTWDSQFGVICFTSTSTAVVEVNCLMLLELNSIEARFKGLFGNKKFASRSCKITFPYITIFVSSSEMTKRFFIISHRNWYLYCYKYLVVHCLLDGNGKLGQFLVVGLGIRVFYQTTDWDALKKLSLIMHWPKNDKRELWDLSQTLVQKQRAQCPSETMADSTNPGPGIEIVLIWPKSQWIIR